MATLKAQIQPHFLFNTLNSISASLPIEQEPTRKSIARLADTFRFAMNTAEKEQVPFREELEFIQNYLALEQERFTDRLRVVYAVDEAALQSCVPPFLLQPLIENALKHGIGKSIEGGTLELLVRVEDQKTCFEIRDTGAGLNGYTKSDLLQKGIGLKNTRERLLKLFNEEIQISSLDPKGTKVQFSIPYIPCHA
jgi:LytS/YehU family sensor histidine kinase